MNECILVNRRIAIDKIFNELDISHGSVHKISDQLKFQQFCAQQMLQLVTEEHKGKSFLKVCLNFYNFTKRKETDFGQECD